MTYIDISVGIKDGMLVWPGDKAVEVGWDAKMADGHESNVSYIRMGAHCGTHIDMPLHFIEGGKTTEDLELDVLIGTVEVVEVPEEINKIDRKFLESIRIENVERVLFKTRTSRMWAQEYPQFDYEYVALDSSGAEWLVEHGCRLVGVDAMAVIVMEEIIKGHEILLGNDVVVLETLNLGHVEPGKYELICLPMKLIDREATPVRAILKV
ncbi:MAG: cyclase family protein [Anaerolineaceae bacterium]|jgi:arylformamidase